MSAKEVAGFEETIEVVLIIIKSVHVSISSRYVDKVISSIFIDIWALLKYFFEKFFSHEKIIESLCQLMKHFVRGMNVNFIPYIDQYFSIIINGYRSIPISSYLYSFEIIITSFMNETSITSKIIDTLEILCNQTLTYLPDLSKNNLLYVKYRFI